MNAKEFDLFLALILDMLEDGKTERVIKLIKEAQNKDPNGNKKKEEDD